VGSLLVFILFFSVLNFINFGFYQKEIIIFLISISTISAVYYFYIARKLHKILFIHQSLKIALENVIALMNKFSQIYVYASIILTPLGFLAG